MSNPTHTREEGRGPIGSSNTAASPDNDRVPVNTPGPIGHNDPFSPFAVLTEVAKVTVNALLKETAKATATSIVKAYDFVKNCDEIVALYEAIFKEYGGMFYDYMATLVNEGMSGDFDDLPGKAGDAVDNRYARMQKIHHEYSRKNDTRAMLIFDKLAGWFAGGSPMKKKLFDYYLSCQGRNDLQYKLTYDEVKMMPTYFDLFNPNGYSPKLVSAVNQAKAGTSVYINTSVNAGNDPLGNFTIYVNGVIGPATDTPNGSINNEYAKLIGKYPVAILDTPLKYEGKMIWYDNWDFDSKVGPRLRGINTGRSYRIEAAVDLVAMLCDGVDFKVESDAIPMIQYSGFFPEY
jgi:hypothetical protein